MTLAQVHNPTSPISAGELDSYLSKAWFRMGQTIFTTHILHYNNKLYSAIWLRIDLDTLFDSDISKKWKKNKTIFRTVIRPAFVDEEKETLFAKYRQSVSFEASASMEALLYGKLFPLNVYDTYEIAVYDGSLLIAVGIFDLGKESAAGISCFYDPDYKKYSLGKYLIYSKIEYCKQKGIHYFYPGYFVPGNPTFDYKLDIGKKALYYYALEKHQWISISGFRVENSPLERMRMKLELFLEKLTLQNIPAVLFQYEYYNANLIPDLFGMKLFDFPLFLYCFEITSDSLNPIIVYDVRDEQYHLLECESLFATGAPILPNESFTAHLLKTKRYFYSTAEAAEMIGQLTILDAIIQGGFQNDK